MFMLKSYFINKVKKIVYDPLLTDSLDNIEQKHSLIYMGHAYDKLNFRNDRMRLANDLSVSIQEAKGKFL